MTNQEYEIYTIINNFINENGYAPTVREICKLLGGRSTGTVHYHLKSMKDKNIINYVESMSRTITIKKDYF